MLSTLGSVWGLNLRPFVIDSSWTFKRRCVVKSRQPALRSPSASIRPAQEERPHPVGAVGASLGFSQLDGRLGTHEPPVVVQHVKVGDAGYLFVLREKLRILVVGSIVDGNRDEVLVTQAGEIGMLLEQFVHLVAVDAPIAAHIKDDALFGALRFGNRRPKIGGGIVL